MKKISAIKSGDTLIAIEKCATVFAFESDDGRVFIDEAKCAAWDAMNKALFDLDKLLQARPEQDGCNFVNGDGYIQHAVSAANEYKLSLIKIIRERGDYGSVDHWLDAPDAHPSWIGRLVDECCPQPINKRWYRVMCMDKKGREYGQPYFADNPDKLSKSFVVR